MSGIRIASRYAKSLLDLCIERGQLDVVKADMEMIDRAMDSNRDLRVMLSSPVINTDAKVDILNRIFKGNVAEMTLAFILLLTKKGREKLLPEVVDSFINQVRTHRGITSAEVTSAIALDATSRQQILDAAMKLAGGPIELIEKVDTTLIGGFVLKVGDKQLDSAISSRIKALKREFSENPYIPEL
jgi:F-type H+-transporting ATPase subunit delta